MKPTSEHYDAIVVGAGPAGSTAAKRLAQGGLKVLMLEQRTVIGRTVQCAEFVPLAISRHAVLRACDIAQQVQGIKTLINGEPVSTLHAPGYVLNRVLWDEYQAQEAKTAGVTIKGATRAIHIEGTEVTLVSGAQSWKMSAKYILGCDGPRSIISKKLGNEPQEMCAALQYEMMLTKPLEHAEIYFDPAYYGGYAWVFPKGKTANVGVAVHDSYRNRLKPSLADFCRKIVSMGVIHAGAVSAATGGLIPAGGLVKNLANDHLLVAGDAAGCTHPITGAGIMNAVVSGHLAALAVILQVNSNGREQVSKSYTRMLLEEYGTQFTIASDRLMSRNQRWTDNPEEFSALIRRSWIAFPEYYMQ
ncbi:geranylgeranyl reductase family protein [Sporomusa malonica]|uniref:Geranylgeranyl reductase family n=1 Tax=Sporomusa malonica TaxID=112901 RepID=A0A1W2EQS5_9FIRM|nr:NAD(P)/FAD-dependent oxidoreductase [Sporomusa malonica]SMD12073.1 geranylgeranyl reductase family [Sporomusa malonica]